jgi:hypothetical protein
MASARHRVDILTGDTMSREELLAPGCRVLSGTLWRAELRFDGNRALVVRSSRSSAWGVQ